MILLLRKTEIVEKIKEHIIKENLKENDKLPSERKLCEMWNVNRKTIREGIDILIKEGKLYKKHGSGTYLSEEKIKRNLWEFSSFTDAIEKSSNEVITKVIDIRKSEANKIQSKKLKVTLGSKLINIKRLRIVKDKPLAIETSIIPYKYCEEIEGHDLENNSLYEILEKHYKIELVSQTQEISIAHLGRLEKEYLEIDEPSALMLKGITFDGNKRPIEYCESITRGDRCKFTSILR